MMSNLHAGGQQASSTRMSLKTQILNLMYSERQEKRTHTILLVNSTSNIYTFHVTKLGIIADSALTD